MAKKKNALIIGEFPVFHKGYINFLKKRAKEESNFNFLIAFLEKKLIEKFTQLEPDIRKIDLTDIKKIINLYLSPKRYFILKEKNWVDTLKKLQPDKIFILRGEKSEDFFKKYLADTSFEKRTKFFNIKLRWPKSKVFEAKKSCKTRKIQNLQVHCRFLKKAKKEAQKSNCWWRQTGAVLVRKGKILLSAYNRMLPEKDECYKVGCVRDKIPPGKDLEICSAIHAEANIIAMAAKQGFSLKDSTIYLTHFPCPVCAKLIALSGIKNLFYEKGSSVFDGGLVLRAFKVKINRLECDK